MATGRPKNSAQRRVVLQGGGRLERVAQVVDIRLEAGEINWRLLEPSTLDVNGDIRAYLYCVRPDGRTVEGEGLNIPFSTRIELTEYNPDTTRVTVDDLSSKHDYDPVTGDFQHTIAVVLSVSDCAEDEPDEDGGNKVEAAYGGNLGSASGETCVSQIRVGPNTSDGESAEPDDEVTGDWKADVEAKAVEAGEGRRLGGSKTGESETEESETWESDDTREHQMEVPAESPQRDEDGGVLVWKPFPPPITN